MTCPGPHLAARPGPGRSGPGVPPSPAAALGQRLPRKNEQSPVSSPRDTPCTALLPPQPRLGRPLNLGRAGRRAALGEALQPPRAGYSLEAAWVPPPPPPPPPPRRPRGAAGWEPRRPHPSRPPLRLFRVRAGPQPPCPTRLAEPPGKTAPGRQRASPQTPPTEPRTHSHSEAGTRSARQPRPWRTWRPSPGLC